MNYFSENKKMVKFCFYLMIYILTIVSTIIGQNTWNETVKYINNVPRIENPENPIFSKIEITLEKVWEIGGENFEFIFQNTTSLDVDENGYIFVADVLEDDIKVFSPTGEYLFKFGRKGQGPGEFQSPRCLTILPNKKILVIDLGGGSIIPYFKFFNIEGKYIDGYRVNLRKNESGSNQIKINKKDILSMPRIFYSQLFNDNNLIIYTESREDLKYKVNSLWIYDFNNQYAKRIICIKRMDPLLSGKRKLNDQMYINTQWCNDKNGNIYFIDNIYDYKIGVYDSLAKIIRVISRDFKLPKKSDDEFKKDIEDAEKYTKRERRAGKKITYETLKYNSIIFNLYPCTRSMFCDDENRLWILTNESVRKTNSNKNTNNTYRFSFDVFNDEGQYILKIPLNANEPRCFVLKSGYLHFVDYKKDGFPWLLKYKINFL